MTLRLDSPCQELKGIGPSYEQYLRERGIQTVFDLLLFFPEDYLDISRISEKPRPGAFLPYRMELKTSPRRRFLGRGRSILRIKALVAGRETEIVFFNRPYLQDSLRRHDRFIVFGRLEDHQGKLQMVNPRLLPAETRDPVIPVYRPLGPIRGGVLQRILRRALDELDWGAEVIPTEVSARHGFPGLEESLKTLHGLKSVADGQIEKMRKPFIYLEFLLFHLELKSARLRLRRQQRRNFYDLGPESCRQAFDKLPFKATADQRRAFSEITADLARNQPMARLLQGEVGSGKTAVAFLVLRLVLAASCQAAFLAPTAILAAQHYANAGAYFENSRLGLLTGATPGREKKEIMQKLAAGEIDLVFGTHALLADRVCFKRLALVIIDEQHRFGVAQRAALHCKQQAVDLLVMSATPIPRTLALTLYQDLDLTSSLRPPPGRRQVVTRIVPRKERASFYRELRQKISSGGRGFIVLPLIEKSLHNPHLLAVNEDGSAICNYFASAAPSAVLSGETTAREKDRIINRFRSGEIRLLVSTSLIEVGLDVPEAGFMVIENAERFGLSQLHQLRGRIGRGSEAAECFLLPSAQLGENGKLRLQAIRDNQDGLKIAEADLRLRGGGTPLGRRQSGRFSSAGADPETDFELFQAAAADASALLDLKNPLPTIISAHLDRHEETIAGVSFS